MLLIRRRRTGIVDMADIMPGSIGSFISIIGCRDQTDCLCCDVVREA